MKIRLGTAFSLLALCCATYGAPIRTTAQTSRQASATGWTVLGWNDLGMHCMDGDYTVFSILPPYNTIHAQLIDSTGHLVKAPSGTTITYTAISDADGSINTSSTWKTTFWTFVSKLFGATPAPNTGLTGNSMPGTANTPQAMKWDGSLNWFTADGIPMTSWDDAGNKNYYPMLRLTARDSGGNVLATTDIVTPVSDEMSCKSCHASGRDETKPSAGWANDPIVERDYKINILRLHDDKQANSSVFKSALQGAGYSSSGLAATSAGGTPILCAKCHASNALGTTGQTGVPALTKSIHSFHANVMDDATGAPLDSSTNRDACYQCHPGSSTRCLRGVMGNSVASDGSMAMQCQNCHGTMSTVGGTRQGWLEEPNCQSCHTGNAVSTAGQIRYTSATTPGGAVRQAVDSTFATTPNVPAAGLSLYRFSSGHGGLQCEACHGSTHAEFPSSHANDNVQSAQVQGHTGFLSECSACHKTVPLTANLGPHGMHSVGDTWIRAHDGPAENSTTACQNCHGTDLKGTVLSAVFADRSFSTKFGVKTLFRGAIVGCYTCHNGPKSEQANSNVPPSATSVAVQTQAGKGATVNLAASGGTVRIVSQPANGSVALSGNSATYTPFDGFEGTDTFTFASWTGTLNSNLATVTVAVAAQSRPSFAANGIVNAASYQGGSVSPGEIVALFGTALGPVDPAGLQVNSAGLVSRALSDTRVLFDGSPAPLLYTSSGQLGLVVPYSVAGKSSTQVQVEYRGIRSVAVAVPVADAAPGIFTVAASGAGQGAIINQNATVNGPSAPAAKGSYVSIYGTGEGSVSRSLIDGQLATADLWSAQLPVSVTIGGVKANTVSYAGGSPGNVAGLLQVNVVVPPDAPSGAAVPVVLTIGTKTSQQVTMAIQ